MKAIEKKILFSKSMLWEIQRDYFNKRGVDAWRKDHLPDYITSNPSSAKSYAEIIFGFLSDLSLKDENYSTVYAVEIGGGPGRFAFHFLKIFDELCSTAQINFRFCYLLTDLSRKNMNFWKKNRKLKSFIDRKMLDFAIFDIQNDTGLKLEISGRSIEKGSLDSPIIVIANYVLDTIPQDLFFISSGNTFETKVTLYGPNESKEIDLSTIEEGDYDYEKIEFPYYKEPLIDKILDNYGKGISATHLLFPYIGLRCLDRLKALSKNGVMVISGDKGYHHKNELLERPAPVLVHHGGCFSLSVNYHAFRSYCELNKGLAMVKNHHSSLNIVCLLMVSDLQKYSQTKLAYHRFVSGFGPDDFYSLKKPLDDNSDQMEVHNILAYLRLSYYDSWIFIYMVPRLLKILPKCSFLERDEMIKIASRIWDMYYPVDSGIDIAFQLGLIMCVVEEFKKARGYFEYSLQYFGESASSFYNLAVCWHQLDRDEKAIKYLERAIELEPDHKPSIDLKEIIES